MREGKDDVFLPEEHCVAVLLCHLFVTSFGDREVKLGCETLFWNQDI